MGMVHLCRVCVSWWLTSSSFASLAVGCLSAGAMALTEPGVTHHQQAGLCLFTWWPRQGCQEPPALCVSHLLMPHWPKLVTWPRPDSRSAETGLSETDTAKSVKLRAPIAKACADRKHLWSFKNLPPYLNQAALLPAVLRAQSFTPHQYWLL